MKYPRLYNPNNVLHSSLRKVLNESSELLKFKLENLNKKETSKFSPVVEE